RGHRVPRGEASVIPFPKVKSDELASYFNCEADLAGNRWFESSYASVIPFPKVKSDELASYFNCEADLAGNRWFESSYPAGPRVKHRVQFVDRLAHAAR